MAFTITLPSNSSMTAFPDNTLTTYTTLLAEYVSLSDHYECALLEVTCPTTWYNLLPEDLMTIEGISTDFQTSSRTYNTTGLKMSLNADFVKPHTDPKYNEVDERGNSSVSHSNTGNMLERGVEINITTVDRPLDTPSGVHKLSYTEEIGEFPNLHRRRERFTPDQVNAVIEYLELKPMDRVVTAALFGKSRKYRAFKLPSGYTDQNSDLIDRLNIFFNKTQPYITTALRSEVGQAGAMVFYYDRLKMKCTIHLPPNIVMRLPQHLAYQLGFGKRRFVAGTTTGTDVVDLNYKSHTVYIYSDVIEDSLVGDSKVPLLRTVTLNPTVGSSQTVSFQHLMYQPVCRTSFRELTVYLRDNTGQPIPFERGQVTIVLAFRPTH